MSSSFDYLESDSQKVSSELTIRGESSVPGHLPSLGTVGMHGRSFYILRSWFP
jgi:hypothetical protein